MPRVMLNLSQEGLEQLARVSSGEPLDALIIRLAKRGLRLETADKDLFAVSERRLTLLSDIFDMARADPVTLSREDLELLDQNISERLAEELNYDSAYLVG